MTELYGKVVLSDFGERIDPRHTAILVVDMQNDFCSPGGMIDRLGHSLDTARDTVERLSGLLEAGRSAGVPVFYIKNRTRADGAYNAPSDLARRLLTYAPKDELLITQEGSWGEEVVDELAPNPNDVCVIKHRPDAFERTSLSLMLRSREIKSVVVTGTATFACVECTARRALMEDYYVTVVSDCVMATDPDLHDASLRVMGAFFGEDCIRPAADLASAWQRTPVAS